jgi:hypothetical protein
MSLFPLPAELAAIHDDVIQFSSAIQNTIAAYGGCRTMASEALNVLNYNALLTHRGVRSLCEEGWTPLTPILNRTLLDIFANCIAVINEPANADYMGFKYLSEFHRKWMNDPGITDPERAEVNVTLDMFISRLPATDQPRATRLISEGPTPYWFRPEYNTPADLLRLSPHNLHAVYKLFSGPTHGGLGTKLLFNDDPGAENISPREHPKNTPRAITASARLLLEVCYLRDQWDNRGVGEEVYRQLVARLNAWR